jgi:hypothetical protein
MEIREGRPNVAVEDVMCLLRTGRNTEPHGSNGTSRCGNPLDCLRRRTIGRNRDADVDRSQDGRGYSETERCEESAAVASA